MIYTLLQKRKRKAKIHQTDDYKFYAKNAPIYAQILSFYHFGLNESQPFRIIQANIIIKAMMNKELIESELDNFSLESTQNTCVKQDEFIKSKVWKLLDDHSAPYFSQDKSRIYVPIFSRSLNLIYNEENSKLLEYPYNNLIERPETSCVDLFDTYGIDLYNSPFTSLILIRNDKTSSAFYHHDFETLYIINDQGRLDLEIPLYDKYIKNPDQHKIINKIEDVVEKFYSNDYFEFVRSLYKNRFISRKTYNKIRYKISLNFLWKEKIFRKGKDRNEVL